jgi:hypothetical protein
MNGEGGEAYQRGVAERNKRGFKRGGILRKYLKAYHE